MFSHKQNLLIFVTLLIELKRIIELFWEVKSSTARSFATDWDYKFYFVWHPKSKIERSWDWEEHLTIFEEIYRLKCSFKRKIIALDAVLLKMNSIIKVYWNMFWKNFLIDFSLPTHCETFLINSIEYLSSKNEASLLCSFRN